LVNDQETKSKYAALMLWGSFQAGFPKSNLADLAVDYFPGRGVLAGYSLLAEPPRNPRFIQIVRRHFHLHSVAHSQPHPALSHFATNRREDDMTIVQFDTKHRAREDYRDGAFHFNMLFSRFHHLPF
jgi:hypothetical protein